jgi:hypothetical protein
MSATTNRLVGSCLRSAVGADWSRLQWWLRQCLAPRVKTRVSRMCRELILISWPFEPNHQSRVKPRTQLSKLTMFKQTFHFGAGRLGLDPLREHLQEKHK